MSIITLPGRADHVGRLLQLQTAGSARKRAIVVAMADAIGGGVAN